MARLDAQRLDESLSVGDVSLAWLVWSAAAETALADAYRFAGGSVPARGLTLGRGTARFRVARLGGPEVRKARGNVADADEGGDVFTYRDSSIASLLDLWRRFKAVVDVLDAMIRDGISLARSVELTAQWDEILRVGPVNPITLEDFPSAWCGGLGEFRLVMVDLHCRLTDFVHRVVVHRGDDAVRGWRNSLREEHLVHPFQWLRPDLLVPPAPFLQCEPHLTPGGSGVLADPARIDEEFRKAWLPYFCRSEVDGCLPLLPVVSLPELTGEMLAEVVRRKSAAAGSLDGWGWRELKVLPVPWFDGLARVLSKVKETGVWHEGLLDACIATLAARVRLVITHRVLVFVLPLDFHWRLRVIRSMCIPGY